MVELFQIVYFSTLRPEFNAQETVDSILDTARENNKVLGVTGMLLYNGGTFLQVLEGERRTITYLYGKICKDQRHFNLNTIVTSPLGERIFNDWSMGYKDLEKLDKDHSDLKELIEGMIKKSLSHNKMDVNEVKLLLRKFRFK